MVVNDFLWFLYQLLFIFHSNTKIILDLNCLFSVIIIPIATFIQYAHMMTQIHDSSRRYQMTLRSHFIYLLWLLLYLFSALFAAIALPQFLLLFLWWIGIEIVNWFHLLQLQLFLARSISFLRLVATNASLVLRNKQSPRPWPVLLSAKKHKVFLLIIWQDIFQFYFLLLLLICLVILSLIRLQNILLFLFVIIFILFLEQLVFYRIFERIEILMLI